MIAQYTAASLVSENKVLAHPASVDSISVSGAQEDHVSMGTTAARQAREIVHNTVHVLATELAAAVQAHRFLNRGKMEEEPPGPSKVSSVFPHGYRQVFRPGHRSHSKACQGRHNQLAFHHRGAATEAAENTPVEPDPDNAGVGKLIIMIGSSLRGLFR